MYTTDRLVIRACRPTDHPWLDQMLNDVSVQSLTDPCHLQPAPPHKVETVLKALAGAYFFGIVTLKDPSSAGDGFDGPMGYVFLRGGEDVIKNRTVMLGLALDPKCHGRGYGTEVTRFVVDWAFRDGGLHRVWLGVYENNEGAKRVYEKAGFVQEGIIRKSNWRNGRWWNSTLMGILEEDWEKDQSYHKVAHKKTNGVNGVHGVNGA